METGEGRTPRPEDSQTRMCYRHSRQLSLAPSKRLPTRNLSEPADGLSLFVSASVRLSSDDMAPNHPPRREGAVDVAAVRRLGQTLCRCQLLFLPLLTRCMAPRPAILLRQSPVEPTRPHCNIHHSTFAATYVSAGIRECGCDGGLLGYLSAATIADWRLMRLSWSSAKRLMPL